MKNTSANFKTRLGGESENLAICIRVVRRDGTILGFTTWDKSFSYDFLTNTDAIGTVTYTPHEAFTPSDISSSSDLGVDNTEILGVLSSNGLDANELSAGLYEGAEVTVFRVDPDNLSEGEMIDKRGYIGEVTLYSNKFVAEVLTSSSYLRRNVGEVSSPTCRVRKFCNEECKLNVATYTHNGDLAGTVSPRDLTISVVADSSLGSVDRFIYGLLKVSYNGVFIEREIKSITLDSGTTYDVVLREPFGIEFDSNVVEIVEGCDRLPATCISLGNMVNFRGEPHLPGIDTLVKVGRPPE